MGRVPELLCGERHVGTVDSAQQPPRRGRQAILEFDKAQVAAFPDRRGELNLVLGNGPHLVGVATWLATNEGSMPGPDGKPMPATHKKIGQMMVHAAELDSNGSHVVSDAVYFDETTMLAQLGLIKAPVRPVMSPPGAAPLVVVAKNDETESRNAAAVQAVLDLANKHDLKAFEAALPDDYVSKDMTQPKDLKKKEAVAALGEYLKGFPDMALTSSGMWAAGDYVVLNGTFNGTNTGSVPSMHLKPTGKKIAVRFIEIFKLTDGKIREDWTFFNSAAMASQLGMK
jgi:steroid delta-isomerase-like uncharacterized protein